MTPRIQLNQYRYLLLFRISNEFDAQNRDIGNHVYLRRAQIGLTEEQIPLRDTARCRAEPS
jgi:hypothetical protein